MHRRLAEWIQHWRRPPAELLGDNLAVGFFTTPAPTSIADLAAAFLVRGTGVGNGELTAHVGADQVTVAERITNIPLHLVVVVREDAVTYFAGSLAGAHGAGSHPMMRPLAVADGRPTAPLHLGVEQNVLGEIGFSVDTRVYGARVVELPGLGQWPGTAHAADRLRGNGALASSAQCRSWEARIGGATRTEAGLRTDAPTLVVLDPGRRPAWCACGWTVRRDRRPRWCGGPIPAATTSGSRSRRERHGWCAGAWGRTRRWRTASFPAHRARSR